MPKLPDGGWLLDDSELERLIYSPICSHCKHLIWPYNHLNPQCKAFARIPDEIWNGEHDHHTPFPGDNGIQFEPKSDDK